MKKLFFMVLFALFAVGVQAQVQAQVEWQHGDNIICTWNTSTSTLTLSGTGEMKDGTCDGVCGKTKVEIMGNLIEFDILVSSLAEKIVIEDGITSIGAKNFMSFFKKVKTVKLPYSVKQIGANAFNGCLELATIDGEINEDITIGDDALDDTNLIGADGILYFGNNLIKAYTNYNTASEVTVISGTTKIYPNAFEGYGMERIIIPESVKSIEDGTFKNCANLKDVRFEGNVISVSSIGNEAFSGCKSLKDVRFEGNVINVSSIGNYAFSGCEALESINIPNTVETWGSNVFDDCTSLTVKDGYRMAGNNVIVKVVDTERSFYDLSGISYIAEKAFFGVSGKVECFGSIPMAASSAFEDFSGNVYVNDGDETTAKSKLKVDPSKINHYTIEVSDAEFSTVSLPFCSDVSQLKGVTVYRAVEDGDVIKLVKVEKMDKEYGYVVYRQGGGEVIFKPLGEVYNESAPNLMVNCYKGANYVFGSDKYVLVLGNNGVEFQCLDQNSANIPAGKSYLEVSSGSTQKLYRTIFDDATGIEEVYEGKTSQKKSGIYSLSGQRLSQARKGLNIINGQVVLK